METHLLDQAPDPDSHDSAEIHLPISTSITQHMVAPFDQMERLVPIHHIHPDFLSPAHAFHFL